MHDKTGLALGKFNPPLLGHLHLINTGATHVNHLYVLLCDRSDQTLSIEKRLTWLKEVVPKNVSIIVTKDDIPTENQPWAERALEILPESPDVVFTSEEYGESWAKLMGAKHFLVDMERTNFPISGTDIRKNLKKNFHWLVPSARADLAKRVVLVGAESTGKSTMAEALAKKLSTVWVPEHGRWYWEGRRYLQDQSWSSEEFHRLAESQKNLEKDLARLAHRGLIICDTDALVTAAWQERYLGAEFKNPNFLSDYARPALYLICCPDFNWVQDGSRESKNHRISLHESIKEYVESTGAEYVFLNGPHHNRLINALDAIKKNIVFQKMK